MSIQTIRLNYRQAYNAIKIRILTVSLTGRVDFETNMAGIHCTFATEIIWFVCLPVVINQTEFS